MDFKYFHNDGKIGWKHMKLKSLIHIALLIAGMQFISAYKFRCYWFCTEQTAIQNDYVSNRDECRRYAQLRIETDTANPELMDEKARKAKLISLFSACMSDNGWTIPDGKGSQQASPPVPVPSPATANNPPPPAAAAAPAAAPVAAATAPAAAIMTEEEAKRLQESRREKNYLARQSECAFARHSAAYSSVAATRAQACDIECAQHKKALPGTKRPAACPTDPSELDMNQGK